MEDAVSFIHDNWTAPIEILILSVALYYIYKYLMGTRGARILIGLALVVLTLTLISQLLKILYCLFIAYMGTH